MSSINQSDPRFGKGVTADINELILIVDKIEPGFDNYDRRLKAAEESSRIATEKADSVKGIADEAKAAADAVKGIADEAKTLADAAKTAAREAKAEVNTATTLANTAITNAGAAQAATDKLSTDVTNTRNIAVDARGIATSASAVANAAKTAADAAKTAADAAIARREVPDYVKDSQIEFDADAIVTSDVVKATAVVVNSFDEFDKAEPGSNSMTVHYDTSAKKMKYGESTASVPSYIKPNVISFDNNGTLISGERISVGNTELNGANLTLSYEKLGTKMVLTPETIGIINPNSTEATLAIGDFLMVKKLSEAKLVDFDRDSDEFIISDPINKYAKTKLPKVTPTSTFEQTTEIGSYKVTTKHNGRMPTVNFFYENEEIYGDTPKNQLQKEISRLRTKIIHT